MLASQDSSKGTTDASCVDSASHSFTVKNNCAEDYDMDPSDTLEVMPSMQSSADVEAGVDDADFNREMYRLLMDSHPQPIYSRKVFLGGLPPHISTEELQIFFSTFGTVEIGWPVAENSNEHDGFMFATFTSADSVIKLVENCVRLNGRLTINMPLGSGHSATINIRVWCTKDVKYCSPECGDSILKNTRNCVFVGGIPRTMTARQLSYFMSLTFGDVTFAKIEVELETDYPKGAGCVMFRDREAFVAAIASRFVPLNTGEHLKQIELQPYLMRLVDCDICQTMKTRNFCPKLRCLKFMCEMCWKQAHVDMPEHQPLVRSPPLRARASMHSNGDDRSMEHYIANDPATFKPSWARHNNAANGARNLCQVVNSIQFPSVSLFDPDSDGHTDWNTDCGIFDSRGPPGSTFRSQQLPDTHYQPFIPRRVRGRSAPFSERNTNCVDHRSRWRRASPHRHSNTSRCRHCSSIRSNHFNTYNGTDYRHRLHCHRYDESHENPNYFYSSRCIEDNLWSERISGLSGSSCARSVIASNVNQLARHRVSFSPTVRRPARRHTNAEVQYPTSNASEPDENIPENVIGALAQFKLF